MTMSVRTKSDVASPVLSAADAVAEARALWAQTYVRRLVKPSMKFDDAPWPLAFQSVPPFPGAGQIADLCSTIPVVTVENLPVSAYPEYGPQIVMYTMATLLQENPDLMLGRDVPALLKSVTAVALARCHSWAMLGRVPSDSESVSPAPLRYSARNKAIVVRPATNPEPVSSALWRHCLAVSPRLLAGTQSLCSALSTMAPSLFMYGAALHLGVGQVFYLHHLEASLMSSLRSSIPAAERETLGATSPGVLMTMSAAAVSGYRASVIRAICEDGMFATKAQMILSGETGGALAARYQALVDEYGTHTLATPVSKPARASWARDSKDDDDTVSVADTEVSEAARPMDGTDRVTDFFARLEGDETPRPQTPMDEEAQEAIRRIARHAAENNPVPATQIEIEPTIGDMNF